MAVNDDKPQPDSFLNRYRWSGSNKLHSVCTATRVVVSDAGIFSPDPDSAILISTSDVDRMPAKIGFGDVWVDSGARALVESVLPSEFLVSPIQGETEFWAVHFAPEEFTSGPALIGRGDELEKIIGLIEQNRLVQLVGIPGVGKSSLLRSAAAILSSSTNQSVRMVSLHACPARANLGYFIAQEATHSSVDGPYLPILKLGFRDEPMILMIDQAGAYLNELGPLVEEILAELPHVGIVIASHIVFEHPAAVRMDLAPLPTCDPDASEDDIHGSATYQLFVAQAERCGDTTFSPEDAPLVAQICRDLEGVPGSILVAASWTRELSLEQIIVRTAANEQPDALKGPLAKVFAASFSSATADCRKLIGFASHANGVLSQDELVSLADAAGLTAEAADAEIGDAKDRFFLLPANEGFRIPRLLRNLAKDDNQEAYVNWLTKRVLALSPPAFATDIPSLSALVRRLEDATLAIAELLKCRESAAQGIKLALGLFPVFFRRCMYEAGVELYESVLRMEGLPTEEELLLRHRLIHMLSVLSRFLEARALCVRTMLKVRRLGAKVDIANIRYSMGVVRIEQCHYRKAMRHFRRAAALRKELELWSPALVSQALYVSCAENAGEIETAFTALAEAESLVKDHPAETQQMAKLLDYNACNTILESDPSNRAVRDRVKQILLDRVQFAVDSRSLVDVFSVVRTIAYTVHRLGFANPSRQLIAKEIALREQVGLRMTPRMELRLVKFLEEIGTVGETPVAVSSLEELVHEAKSTLAKTW
ncbi:MAG: hypothetical protein ACOYON_03825 [Fimbriimonas sp.]